MTPAPVILDSVAALRAHVSQARKGGQRIALVPTMGALHDGHMALVERGFQLADHVIVSIFVNPTQFGPHEDFAAYPRTWDADMARLTNAGVQAVFRPPVGEMYPEGAATTVAVKGITETLDGPLRPGHFDGMATIVAKLLLQTMPDIALFGEKDYQQLQVVRRMVRDLDIPVQIVGVPTVRDENGLALSSRNAYLSATEKTVATRLNGILHTIAVSVRDGVPWPQALQHGQEALAHAGYDSIDYLEVRNADSLQTPGSGHDSNLRVLAAVRLGKTRLIDNVGLDHNQGDPS